MENITFKTYLGVLTLGNIFKTTNNEFKLLKSTLSNMNSSVPTLYKQYSDIAEKNGVRFCAYNVDPDFSNCVDSFIIVEIEKIKESHKKRYFV